MAKDVSIAECRRVVAAFLAVNKSTKAYQKFTCANCGQRLTMEEPNEFFDNGSCDKCGHVTDIRKTGCGYMLTFGLGAP